MAHASAHEILHGAELRNVVIHVPMLGEKGERQPSVTTIFTHEWSEQIRGSFDYVHSLVFAPESKDCMHSPQVNAIRMIARNDNAQTWRACGSLTGIG
ncbi:hypothetical protein [Accumulibacter sp.]|uniref:hypothetical protein n=1 Tax=Accumulibacter sp. TaxID=2053492 RepID=UPI00287ADDEA|nr:hypothetical protein [Accumulibacter sp.]MDS4056732.1 hypothetical protein [Accumulibacter sp.]HRF06930.1 hypothetical protein [Accumulibacter sp.]